MDDGSISITQALNQLQSWLNAGEYEKVAQGAKEILEVEPGNQRALALLKQAEERQNMRDTMAPQADVAPSMPDPLASLEVETPRSAPAPLPMNTRYEENLDKGKLLLALVVPAAIVILIGGLLIYFFIIKNREKAIDDVINEPDEQTEEENDTPGYLENNAERVTTLKSMEAVLESFYEKEGAYPAASQFEALLGTLPRDPRDGEVDKAGNSYGYMYAVYNENKTYILSALFEDSEGYGTDWTRGGDPELYPDYREYTKSHVLLIGGDKAPSKNERK